MLADSSPFVLRAAALLFALAIGCSSSTGPVGPAGPPGETGPKGEAGAPFVAQGTLAGTVTAKATGKPLAGATITDDTGAKATAGADGSFRLAVPVGVHAFTFQRAGYADRTLPGVGVSLSGTTHVAVTMDAQGSDGLAIVVSDDLAAGFDSPVTVTAQVSAPDSDPTKLVYGWKQTGGRPATGLAGTSTPSIAFRTLALSDAKLEANPDASLAEHQGALVPARFGVLGFSPDETGNYGFTLTVTDAEGHAASADVTVQATPPTSGLRNVPVGIPVWLAGDSLGTDGAPQATWSWTLDASGAPGSGATLAGATTQFPSLTPDVPGTYAVTESVSGKSANLYAHDWDGVAGGDAGVGNDYAAQGCITAGCHTSGTSIPWTGASPLAPDMFTPWRSTAHATSFARELDGVTPGATGACVSCHTVGTTTYPPAAGNGGFAAVAQKDGWTFPASPDAGTWDDLVAKQPDLAQLGNVQCESCHGPMNVRLMMGIAPYTTADGGSDNLAAMSFGSSVCGQCHGQGPGYPKMEQWKSSPHANLSLAMQFGTVEARGTGAAHCGRCHTAQGYAQYTQQLAAGYTGYLTSDGLPAAMDGGAGADGGPTQTNAATTASLAGLGMTAARVEPQTCAACHDPHNAAGNPFQLRVYDVLPGGLPNGQGPVKGVGAGAVCMACHNQRNGTLGALSLASNPTSIPTPHDGPQTDVLFGVNAFFLPAPTPSPHLAVADTCVGCHYGSPTAAQRAAGETQNHSFVADLTICGNCHGGQDGGGGQVDGLALQQQVKAQMAALDQLLFAKVASALAAAASSGGYTVSSAKDTATGNFLCAKAGTGAPSFTFTVAPAAADVREPQPVQDWRALTTLWMTFPSLGGTPECTSSGALASTTYGGSAPVSVSLNGLKGGTPSAALFPPGGIVAQSIWNEALLHDDQTWGIHNLPFFLDVIDATTKQLGTLP